jgi:Lsr2
VRRPLDPRNRIRAVPRYDAFDKGALRRNHRGMARTVKVVVNDDLDGSPDAQTFRFGLDGATYEIDLAQKNRTKLDKAFASYIEHARRVSRTRGRAGAGRQSRGRGDSATVRAWAEEQGLKVSERGRISADVLQQYEAAH